MPLSLELPELSMVVKLKTVVLLKREGLVAVTIIVTDIELREKVIPAVWELTKLQLSWHVAVTEVNPL